MNNSIIKKMICSICILTVFATVATAIDNPTYVYGDLHWRYNGANYSDDILGGPYYTVENSGWCSENHRTSAANKYNHCHITTTLPYWYGYEQYTITSSMVDDWWDNYYAGYTNSSGCDLTINCWGYAMGHDTWVDSKTEILADEYVASNDSDAEVVDEGGHMLSITGYFPCPEDVTDACWTAEKNRESGIYELSYLHTKWPGGDYFLDKSYASD